MFHFEEKTVLVFPFILISFSLFLNDEASYHFKEEHDYKSSSLEELIQPLHPFYVMQVDFYQ